jgi:hypothetical protein
LEPWVGAGAVVGRCVLTLAGQPDAVTGETATEALAGFVLEVSDTSAPMGLVVAAAWDDQDLDTLTLHPAGTALLGTRMAVEAAYHVFLDRDEDAGGPVVTAAGDPV